MLKTGISGCELRAWAPSDAEALARHANNSRIAQMLRDRFPYPYHLADARAFLEHIVGRSPQTTWAIAVNGEAVGGIGVEPGSDVERVSAEVGYWLGETMWGRGLATAALVAVTAHAFEAFDLSRLFALPFASNAPSIRVLEKAGYTLEGRLRHSAIKGGVIQDQLLYAAYRS